MVHEATVKELAQRNNEPAWLLDKKIKAYRIFSTSQPQLRYGNVLLDASRIDPSLAQPLEPIDCMKVEGGQGAEILTFHEALQHKKLQEYFMKVLNEEDYFTSFHLAFINNGIVVRIPKNTTASTLKITRGGTNSISHVIIIAEPRSNIDIVDLVVSPSEGYQSHCTEIIAQEGSHIRYATLQNLSQQASHFSARKALVSKQASVDWMECHLGSTFSKTATTTMLQGEGSSTKHLGILFGNHQQCFDINVNNFHEAKHTTSFLGMHGALHHSSKAVYKGLTHINKGASGSNGSQKQHILLLSPEAEADPLPLLEIENDDVRCSHAATVSHLDESQLFYLMSRGFDEKEAKKTLIHGFFGQLIKDIPDTQTQQFVEDTLTSRVLEL